MDLHETEDRNGFAGEGQQELTDRLAPVEN
jgi:hypothetical protein